MANALLLLAGLGLLIGGADALVRGGSRLAAVAGISPLVIGLTVVAFGTSAPELAVTVKAATTGAAGMALGNVVGSNIFNVLFILGLSALVAPLVVAQRLVRLDVPLMILLSIGLFLLALDGRIGRLDGLGLCTALLAYMAFLVRQSRREAAAVRAEYDHAFAPRAHPPRRLATDVALVVGGLALLVLGSRWLVTGAVTVALHLGVSELVIGLTIVAAGTSLPEVVTSLVATVRGERDIAVGNVIGSNLFNIMGVLGIAAGITPGGIRVAPALLRFDIPIMIVVALACLPIFASGARISRVEGAVLFAYWCAYTLYLVLAAGRHDALPLVSAVLLYFALPLTALTLAFVALREWRARRQPAGRRGPQQ